MKIYNTLHTSIEETVLLHNIRAYSTKTMLWGRREFFKAWSVLPYWVDLAPNDFPLCHSQQKIFYRKIKWRCSWETSWAQYQLNFTWEESTSNMINDKWLMSILVRVQNHDEYTINWNYFLVKFWINYILLIQKLFITQYNILAHIPDWCKESFFLLVNFVSQNYSKMK